MFYFLYISAQKVVEDYWIFWWAAESTGTTNWETLVALIDCVVHKGSVFQHHVADKSSWILNLEPLEAKLQSYPSRKNKLISD